MRAALLVALALAANAEARIVDRLGVYSHADRRDARQPWGSAAPSGPLLAILPSGSSVPGGDCSGTAVTGSNGESLTFSRSGSAMCQRSDGIWVSVGSNQMRASARPGFAALQLENAATNYIHHSRDLSKANWTKSNMACFHNAVGIDGSSNAASTCLATSSNASVLQVDTSPDSGVFSLFIKRVSGSGAITIKRGSDSYYANSSTCRNILTDEPADVSSGAFVRCQILGYDATPSVGIVLSTAGDAVVIDATQDEARQLLEAPTSPIFTGGSESTRNADILSVTTPAGLVDAEGCVAGTARKTTSLSSTGQARLFTYSSNSKTYLPGYIQVGLTDGSAYAFAFGSFLATSVDVVSSWSGASMSIAANGGAASSTSYDGTLLGASISIGGAADGSQGINGYVGNIRMNNTAGGCAL